jgi:hypothetical protein
MQATALPLRFSAAPDAYRCTKPLRGSFHPLFCLPFILPLSPSQAGIDHTHA